ncbi:MAG: bifunctional folylpolyglutamate synthase/dihydrofolate synthase [Actinobacteria bacterium]|nr:bifunctional folylpolyglutamate synthase/dihydrofolate synthase [Actinomycetota bacterium]
MDFKEAIQYLESTIKYGINPSLSRIIDLCNRLGNPERKFKVIHITGTNGKTSTTKIISSILNQMGFTVGAYTSPHLETVRERIVVNNRMISERDFAECISKIKPMVEEVNKKHKEHLTYFEILTALAFVYFAEKEVDCAVIEVGMGGRWDATNIVVPDVAVVLKIRLDHTDLLGNTIVEIAKEKSKIVKKGCKAITSESQKDVLRIIRERCRREKVELKVYEDNPPLSPLGKGAHPPLSPLGKGGIKGGLSDEKGFSSIIKSKKDGNWLIDIKGIYSAYKNLKLPLIGRHQIDNCAAAVAAVELFYGKALPVEKLKKALAKVKCFGRLELVSENPLIVLDGAHNPDGATALSRALRDEFDYEHLILIIAVLYDKDVESIFNELIPLASMVVVTQNSNNRCAPVEFLKEIVAGFNCDFMVEPKLSSAIKAGLDYSGKDDLICITGSLYTVGEAREILVK